MTDPILSTANRLAELTAEREREMKKLMTSLFLRNLWPQAFDCGPVKAGWGGGIAHDVELHGHKVQTYRITRGDGESRTFAYSQVPSELGGGLGDD